MTAQATTPGRRVYVMRCYAARHAADALIAAAAQLPDEQMYLIFVLANGGTDLHNFELHNPMEARSVLLQVALSLAVSEDACEFEHRDLHAGNVLVQRAPRGPKTMACALRGVRYAAETAGLAVTLIDFTLSRATRRDTAEAAFCNLEDDPAIFKGDAAHCQYETYRRMRQAVRRDWAQYNPKTNALWLFYLAGELLAKVKHDVDQRRELQRFRQRCFASHASACDVVADEYFAAALRRV